MWMLKSFGNSGENLPVNIFLTPDFAKWCHYTDAVYRWD